MSMMDKMAWEQTGNTGVSDNTHKTDSESRVDENLSENVPVKRIRLERLFLFFERALGRFDGWMNRLIPENWNPLAQTGRAANLALIVCVLSGVLMLLWYSPSVQFAHSSLEAIQGRTLGGWIRAIHRYSSDLVMLLLFIHAGRMFLLKKFIGSRWLAWTTGVGLLGLVWLIGWTGFWLVWDQPAQQVAVTSMQFLDAFPIFGEPMSRQFLVDRLVPSPLFFVVFFLHMLLPLGIAAGLVLHLSRLNRVQIFPDKWLSIALVVGIALASWLVPAPLDEPAAMAVKAPGFTVDAWYLTPLALGLRFQTMGLWACLGAVVVLAAFPWIFSRRVRKIISPRDESIPVTPWQTVVLESRCHACTQCVQDCPFHAVSMVARTDGKKFVARAWVNPDLCVGCAVCVGSCDSEAMNLTWFDIHVEEKRITEAAARAREENENAFLALVAADIHGGFSHFQEMYWKKLLPGYHVEPVPTASWVRPKFVERLLKGGVQGVLIVRDTRAESAVRDGNRWVLDRLEGTRPPHFRPARAGNENWYVADFNVSDASALTQEATAFLQKPAVNQKKEKSADSLLGHHRTYRPGRLRAAIFSGILAVLLAVVTIAPSHLQVENPAPMEPELIFSFRVLGDLMEVSEDTSLEDESKPVHMRGRSTKKPQRYPVKITLTIDGESETREFSAKGISSDGPAIDEWRIFLQPGLRKVQIEIDHGSNNPPSTWSGDILAQSRHIHVITHSPADGFLLE